MRALKLTSMTLATILMLGIAKAESGKPAMEVLVVTAKRPIALEAVNTIANDALTPSIDFSGLRIEPPRLDHVKTTLDEIEIDAPRIETVLSDHEPSKS